MSRRTSSSDNLSPDFGHLVKYESGCSFNMVWCVGKKYLHSLDQNFPTVQHNPLEKVLSERPISVHSANSTVINHVTSGTHFLEITETQNSWNSSPLYFYQVFGNDEVEKFLLFSGTDAFWNQFCKYLPAPNLKVFGWMRHYNQSLLGSIFPVLH